MPLAPVVLVALLAVALGAPPPASGSWRGEVVDVACYASTGAVGADNRSCHMEVHRSLPSDLGQPLGLLTDDGTLVLLTASPMTADAFGALVPLLGHKVSVEGRHWERGGMTVVAVEGLMP